MHCRICLVRIQDVISVPAKIFADLTSGLKGVNTVAEIFTGRSSRMYEGKAGNKEKSEIKKSQK